MLLVSVARSRSKNFPVFSDMEITLTSVYGMVFCCVIYTALHQSLVVGVDRGIVCNLARKSVISPNTYKDRFHHVPSNVNVKLLEFVLKQ